VLIQAQVYDAASRTLPIFYEYGLIHFVITSL
jgi:hypothetical protein